MEGISLNWVGCALFQAFKAVCYKKTLLFFLMECMLKNSSLSFVWS